MPYSVVEHQCVCSPSHHRSKSHGPVEKKKQVRVPGQAPDAEEEAKRQRQLHYLLWKDEEDEEEQRRRRVRR